MNASEKCELLRENIADLLELFYSRCQSLSSFDSVSILIGDSEIELNFYDRSI